MNILDPVDFTKFKRVDYTAVDFKLDWMRPVSWRFSALGKKTLRLMKRLKRKNGK